MKFLLEYQNFTNLLIHLKIRVLFCWYFWKQTGVPVFLRFSWGIISNLARNLYSSLDLTYFFPAYCWIQQILLDSLKTFSFGNFKTGGTLSSLTVLLQNFFGMNLILKIEGAVFIEHISLSLRPEQEKILLILSLGRLLHPLHVSGSISSKLMVMGITEESLEVLVCCESIITASHWRITYSYQCFFYTVYSLYSIRNLPCRLVSQRVDFANGSLGSEIWLPLESLVIVKKVLGIVWKCTRCQSFLMGKRAWRK